MAVAPKSQKPASVPPIVENIPQKMKDRPNWTLWDYIWKENKQKWDKPPKDPNTGRSGSSADPAKWSSFGFAVEARERYGYSGVGYCLEYEETAVDLDHVLDETGELMEKYRWIVEEANTYTEVSPGGDGLHLLFVGPKPCPKSPSKRLQADGTIVEMYDHGQYITVTGNVYHDENGVVYNEMRKAPGVLQRIYDEYLAAAKPSGNNGGRGKPKAAEVAAAGEGSMTDEEVLEAMFAGPHAMDAANLMRGEGSKFGDGRSDAVFALMKMLAYYTGGDAEQMVRIFETSGLMKYDKEGEHSSEGESYLQLTARNAIKGTESFYIPAKIRSGAKPAPGVTKARTLFPWYVDEWGTLWLSVDAGKQVKVTTTPPYITADLKDVDTGDKRILVSVTVKGVEDERAYDRAEIMSSMRIVDALGKTGGNFSSANAAMILSYLTDTDGNDGPTRPTVESCRHLGWVREDVGPFMPYDGGNGVRFDPERDMETRASPFENPKGTLEEWVETIYPYRNASTAFRAVLAASFASVLVRVLGVQSFMVYNWDDSQMGKTAAAKAAASVWGNPSPEARGAYFRTLNDTDKRVTKYATFLHDLPVFVDELQSRTAQGGQRGRRQSTQDVIYQLSTGTERGRLNANGSMQADGSWRLLTVATGEIAITDETTMQGALNRVLEICAKPFDDRDEAGAMHEFVAKCYGVAGRAFVAGLQETGGDKLRDEWAKFKPRALEAAGDNPQAANIAFLAFADALADIIVFCGRKKKFEQAATGELGSLSFASDLAVKTATKERRDYGRRGAEFVADWLVRYEGKFVTKSEYSDDGKLYPSIDRYGFHHGGTWYVVPSVLREALREADFDEQKIYKRLRDEEIIECEKGRFTKHVTGRSKSHLFIAIDDDALTEFVAEG